MFLRWILLVLAVPLLLAARCDGKDVEEHILNRIGYGPDAWSLARIRALGPRAYVEEQLQPHLLDDSALEAELATDYPVLAMAYADIRRVYNEYGGGVGKVRKWLSAAKLLRAVHSKRQLEQVLTDFWYNHFNVNVRHDLSRWAALPYERDAIRPHVLGRFEDMLQATARNVAMINYLDNQYNFREGYQRGAKIYGINENYGRELLELHTVGSDTPYTLADIQEVARAFTGWTTYGFAELPIGSDGFLYLDDGHDKGSKTIMGELFIPAGGGIVDGQAVLNYLARHPRTAERVARKLCVRLVSETPPEALVQQAKDVYLSTDGDLYQVTRTILLSDAFQRASGFRTKVKRPLALVASTARALGVVHDGAFSGAGRDEIEKMGEALFEAAPPTGYPEASVAWVAEGTFLRMTNYSYSASGGLLGFAPLAPATGTSGEIADQLVTRVLPAGVSAPTRAALISILDQESASTKLRNAMAALLVSPEFVSH